MYSYIFLARLFDTAGCVYAKIRLIAGGVQYVFQLFLKLFFCAKIRALNSNIFFMSKFSYPENPAKTDLPLLDAIKRRWSPVAFSDEPISEEGVMSLFEAMRWTQSSRNEQPWRVIYATKDDPENFEKLSGLLTEDNYSYAANAYLLVLVCALQNHEYKNKPNRTYQYDVGAATQSMILQAVSMDLVTHVVGGFDKEKPYELYGIPADVSLMTMIVIGYPGDESKVDKERLKKRYEGSRQRKDVSEIAFKDRWQK